MPDGAGCWYGDSCHLLAPQTHTLSKEMHCARRSGSTNHIEPLPNSRHQSMHSRESLYLCSALIRENHSLKLNVVSLASARIPCKETSKVLGRGSRIGEKSRPITSYSPNVFLSRPKSLRSNRNRATFWEVVRNGYRIDFFQTKDEADGCRSWVRAVRNPLASVANYRVRLVLGMASMIGSIFAGRELCSSGFGVTGSTPLVIPGKTRQKERTIDSGSRLIGEPPK